MTKVEIQLATIECCRCGITFGVPELFERTRRNDHQLFYCPAGHSQYFSGKSEAEKLRDILEAERQSYARAREFAENRLRYAKYDIAAAKGKLTKLKNRIANGVCPCCGRTFVQLQRHISNKHPEFAKESTK